MPAVEGARPAPKARGVVVRRTLLLFVLLMVVTSVATRTQVTLFVVQPIGAVPEGRTLVIRRTEKLRFIDSADAVCEREQGGVSLICRGAVLASVAQEDLVLARLSYSDWLYLRSTGGRRYDR